MAREKGRKLDGILLLDKPRGCSSNAALQRARRLFAGRKAGHTGSLDPLADGLLPVCFGEATKFSGYLLHAGKRYRVRMRLGASTTTGDLEGEDVETAFFEHVSEAAIHDVLEEFRGETRQIPPMYSALKHNGTRLYELARKGVEVEREPRAIRIHEIQLIRLEEGAVTLELACSRGTYVRTLVEDIARALNTRGHVAQLRRLSLGPFQGQSMYTLDALERMAEQGRDVLDSALLPVDAALSRWPSVTLDADAAFSLRRGQSVQAAQAGTGEQIRLYDDQGGFLGIGTALADGRVAPKRLLATG